MKNRLRLRRDQSGQVFLGSYEYNQPERISLTQDQPFVDEALRAKGFTAEEIEEQMEGYEIYVPQILARVPQPVPASDLAAELQAAVSDPEPDPEPEDLAEETEDPAEEDDEDDEDDVAPEDIADDPEELQVDDFNDVQVPPVSEIKEMTRDDLAGLAERLGVENEIEGTGANGYVTVPDLRRFLIPYVAELRD